MPLLQNAKKALRVSKRKTVVNQRVKSKMKTAIDAMKADPTQEKLTKAYEAIDMAGKKVIHHNKAARYKSQLAKLLDDKAGKTAKTPAVAKAKNATKAPKAKKTSAKK